MKKLFLVLAIVLAIVGSARAYQDTYSGSYSTMALYCDSSRVDVTGPTIDLSGMTGCLFSVNVGFSGITPTSSNYILIILQESADSTVWTDVTSTTSVLGTHAVADSGAMVKVEAAAETYTLYRFGYVGGKRYVRLLEDYVGTHGFPTFIGAEAITTKRFSGARP